MKTLQSFAGIDFGAKLAGTTAIAYSKKSSIFVEQVRKKINTDQWIFDRVRILDVDHIFIDAPLSLPDVYFKGSDMDDFFYRECDRALGAMSPMFLGGLTARAMKLHNQLKATGVKSVEVYPSELAKTIGVPMEKYKKSTDYLAYCIDSLSEHLPIPVAHSITSWHQMDALLAWLSGYRYFTRKANTYGNPQEGLIVV